MRSTVRYTAGLMIVAGATLALAGPASAAPSGSARSCCFSGGSSGYQGWSPSSRPSAQFGPRGGLSGSLVGPISVTTQIVLNNVGNPQIGVGNYNGGGSVDLSSYTSQFSGLFGIR